MRKNLPIGMFDSGSGGISVLKAFRQVLPQENYFYFGDHQNLPYGEKTPEESRALTTSACDAMAEKGLKALVIACNSASTASLPALMGRYPFLVLGIEPPVAQAMALPGTGSLLVMATTATLSSSRFIALAAPFGKRIRPLPCPGLADLVEAEDSAAQKEYLGRLFAPINSSEVDALVLACTHYPLIKDLIAQAFQKAVPLIEGYEQAAHQLAAQLKSAGLLAEPRHRGQVSLNSSGGKELTARLERFFFD